MSRIDDPRRVRVRKMRRSEQMDPKRSEAAKAEALRRKAVRAQKQARRIIAGDLTGGGA